MPASVNLKLISPSGVGAYAACSQKLVWDTDFPVPYTTNAYADFGTLAHFLAMYKMGLNPPPVDDQKMVEASACSIYRTEALFSQDLDACTDRAIKELPRLPNNGKWVCEIKRYEPSLLPERESRGGEKGFGGYIDLLAADRSQLWDFKFVSRVPDTVKVQYLWQLASYHIIEKVPVCGILFVSRDGKQVGKFVIDFSQKIWAEFAEQVRKGIHAMGLASFRDRAFPTKGESCQWCEHKKRCAAYQAPAVTTNIDINLPGANLGALSSLLGRAKIAKSGTPAASPGTTGSVF